MKTLFIPAKAKLKIDNQKIVSLSQKLPKNIGIVYSIQYISIANEIKNILSKNKKITLFAQVLGCSRINFPKKTQAILLISDGRFHAVSLAYESRLPVFVFDNYSFNKISEEDVSVLKKKQKSAYVKFLTSKNVGILISTKPGQENLKEAIKFKKNLKNKNAYLFLADSIDTKEFENFNLGSWVNTACPRLDMAGEVININNIQINK